MVRHLPGTIRLDFTVIISISIRMSECTQAGSDHSPSRDAFGDRWSQYTFLLLLTDAYEGGRTLFHVDGKARSLLKISSAQPSNIFTFAGHRSENAQGRRVVLSSRGPSQSVPPRRGGSGQWGEVHGTHGDTLREVGKG